MEYVLGKRLIYHEDITPKYRLRVYTFNPGIKKDWVVKTAISSWNPYSQDWEFESDYGRAFSILTSRQKAQMKLSTDRVNMRYLRITEL